MSLAPHGVPLSVMRLALRLFVLVAGLVLGAYLFAVATGAQGSHATTVTTRQSQDELAPAETARRFRPDARRALATRARTGADARRPGGHAPLKPKSLLTARRAEDSAPARAGNTSSALGNDSGPVRAGDATSGVARRYGSAGRDASARRVARPARPARTAEAAGEASAAATPGGVSAPSLISRRIAPGTSMSLVLHTSQLSTNTAAGSVEQFADSDLDLVADRRTTFDTAGGAFDIAVGRTGLRYGVFSAVDDRGTPSRGDDVNAGVLVVGRDANGDFVRDSAATYDLHRDFSLPSAASVVAGASRAGREFVVVSSSGYYNFADPGDPYNEPSAGVVLLVRDQSNAGFDPLRSRTLVRPGDNSLNNANALALLPTGDLLVADFDSNELRVVRDTDADGVPDRLDAEPYYSFRYSDDAPLEVAANSRGVVFTHSTGASTVMLALYDTDADGRADADEVVVEGLSVDDNLLLHGLAVDREGTVYVVEDAAGAGDLAEDGGDGGVPAIDAFPDPALNGYLRDGELFTTADNPTSQALSGLAFGDDPALPAVARFGLTNSASLTGAATRGGLGTLAGRGLTFGRAGGSQADAAARGVRVYVEGRTAAVLSFDDSRVHVHVPEEVTAGTRSVVVTVDGYVSAAEDVRVAEANPALFTVDGSGAGEAVALLASGMRYTRAPVPARHAGEPSVVALFGTGWRNSPPVSVRVGGQAAVVEFAGATAFPGLDQLNVRLPEGVAAGAQPVVVTTAGVAQSRPGVTLTIRQ